MDSTQTIQQMFNKNKLIKELNETFDKFEIKEEGAGIFFLKELLKKQNRKFKGKIKTISYPELNISIPIPIPIKKTPTFTYYFYDSSQLINAYPEIKYHYYAQPDGDIK